MLPPSAALPASLVFTSLAPLLGPLTLLAMGAALIALVVTIAGIVSDRRDASVWRQVPRPGTPARPNVIPRSRSAA